MAEAQKTCLFPPTLWRNTSNIRSAKGIVTCIPRRTPMAETGHWQIRLWLYLPHCGNGLKVHTTQRVFRENEYFSMITVCKKTIKWYVSSCKGLLQGRTYCQNTLFTVARWIAPNGKFEAIARLRRIAFIYDLWREGSSMEIRRNPPRYMI